MFKIVFSDMDGTLLDETMSINSQTADQIHKLEDKGIEFVIATGRQLSEAAPLVEKFDIHPAFITLNGAQVFDESKKLISEHPLSKKQALDINEIFNQEDVYHELVTEKGVISNSYEQRFENMLIWLKNLQPTLTREELVAEANRHPEIMDVVYVDNYDDVIKDPETTILKMVATTPNNPSRIQKIKQHIEHSIKNIIITSSANDNIEINHITATKGNAVTDITDLRNVATKDTLVFGDNLNDKSMFLLDATAVAMENSHPEILKLADKVTSSNKENGVAKYLEIAINK